MGTGVGARRCDPQMLLANAGWMLGLARSLVRDEARAQDIVQETWLAALRSPGIASVRLRGWLSRVLRNFANLQHRREQRVARRERAVASQEGHDATPERLLERAESQRRLVEQVIALPDPYRSTILLRFYENLSLAEMAELTGAPLATTKTHLRRALGRLRERLDDRERRRGADWRALALPVLAVAPAEEATLITATTTAAPFTWNSGLLALGGSALSSSKIVTVSSMGRPSPSATVLN